MVDELVQTSQKNDKWFEKKSIKISKYFKIKPSTFAKLSLSMIYQFLLKDYQLTNSDNSLSAKVVSFDKSLDTFLQDSIFKFKFVDPQSLLQD
ncbi:MAG: hypothetical protein JKY89_02560, partial [Immundisolibacteraceae bacterium]|nr:hypothetical protein [Immundisolibacteraceae bacterium]